MREDWKYVSFEDCLQKVPKQQAVKSKDYLENGLFPIVSQESDLISGYTSDEHILYKHEKPVIIFGDHTKNIKYIDFNFVVGADGVHILSVKDDILPKFFYYELCSIKLRNLGYARHYKLLKEKEICYPDIAEQERIVDLLDDQFAKIDALKANAASQLQAAKDLFQSALKHLLTPQEGWVEKHLGEVCDFSSGFAFKSNLFTSVGEPIIRISDIQEGRVIEDSVAKFNIKSYDIDLSKYIVYPGDILIAMSGGTTGKVGINYTDKCFYLNQRVGVFREKKNKLNHKYLYFYLQTKSDESLKIAAGAAQPNLSTAQIKDFVIPIPSLPEQERIAARLDTISEKVKALQANYDQTITLCNDLKQSLLKSIFA